MATPVTNFGLVTVSTLYDASATSIALTAGHGSRLPATTGGYTYPLTWWNADDYAHPADDPNREIVLVTARSSDTLTVTRAQEGTSATTKNTSGKTYRMSLGITAAMWGTLRTPTSQHSGLQLQTHRDASLATTQVELVSVDSIIMSDGVELRNDNDEWTGLVADSAVSGVGGLDTGTIAAFKYYEIHAIAKEDGTRGLLLHKSKLWAIDVGTVPGDADQPLRAASANTRVAQGFQFNGGPVPFLHLDLKKVGSPTGYYWVTIEADSGGSPSGTALMTSAKLDVSRLGTSYTDVRIPFHSSVSLSAIPTQYWFVIHGNWTINGTDYVAVHMEGTAATYAHGTKSLYNGSAWTADSDDDIEFQLGNESGDAALTMPTGYTKSCFLGWVYADTSALFRPFIQVHRTHFIVPISQAVCSIGTMSESAELFDCVSILPPRHIIKAYVAVTGTGTGTAIAAIGDLAATDISSDSTSTGAQVVIYGSSTTQRPSQPAMIFVQTGAVMAHGTAGGQLWLTGFEW